MTRFRCTLLAFSLGCGAAVSQETGAPSPPTTVASETGVAIGGYVRDRLRLGFESVDEVVTGAQDLFASEGDYPGDDFVAETAERELAELLEAQVSWDRPTDAERLDRAFEALEAQGILARHCYAPTRSWGIGDLNAEASIARSRGVPVRGRVFYTSQDADGLLEGQLALAWGAYLDAGLTFAEEMSVADGVAEAIVRALRAEGLDASWDGVGASVVFVDGLEWRHPRDPETGAPLLSTEPRYTPQDTEVFQRSAEPEAAFRTTAAGEWHVRVAYLANDGGNGAFANLWHVHRRTNPDAAGGSRVPDEFSSEGTYAFDFLPIGLGLIGDRRTRFDLVAPPSTPFFGATRRDFTAMVDAVVLVPADEASLTDLLERAERELPDHGVLLIELDVGRWDEEAIRRLEARFPDQVWVADLQNGDGIFDVLKQVAKLTLTEVKRRVEAAQATSSPGTP